MSSILLFYPLYYAGLLRFHPSMPCVAISTAALAAGSLGELAVETHAPMIEKRKKPLQAL